MYSMILAWTFSSSLILPRSSRSRGSSAFRMTPCTSSSSSTSTPKSETLATLASTTEPVGKRLRCISKGSGTSCLMPSVNFSLSGSIWSTTASTSSPTLYKSLGLRKRGFQVRSDTWTSPSIPSSTPRKMPKLVTFLTLALILEPVGYFFLRASHGFSSICFMPSEIFLFSMSMSMITASTWSPMETIFEGCLMRRVQLISEMWTRPSMPGSSSTKAP